MVFLVTRAAPPATPLGTYAGNWSPPEPDTGGGLIGAVADTPARYPRHMHPTVTERGGPP